MDKKIWVCGKNLIPFIDFINWFLNNGLSNMMKSAYKILNSEINNPLNDTECYFYSKKNGFISLEILLTMKMY